MMTAGLFTDTALLRTRTQTGATALGEPVYTDSDLALKGLLVRRPRQVVTTLGLVAGVSAVYLTETALAEIPAGAVLVVGGTTYRKVTLSRRNDLWGDAGLTRLILEEGP